MAEPTKEQIYLRDPTGNPIKTDDPEHARQLIQNFGATPIGQEEALASQRALQNLSYVDENWGALGKAGMGALSGLTLGIAPGAMASAGLVDPGHVRAAQTSPWYTLGDIGGMALPALFTGGESLAAKAAAMTPAGAIGRLATGAEGFVGKLLAENAGSLGRLASAPIRMATSGAFEGAAFNMGHTLGDALLDNKPLSAESLAASGLDGALFGGLLGGGLGLAGGLAGKAVEGLGVAAKRVGVPGRQAAKEGLVGRTLGWDKEAFQAAEGFEGGAIGRMKAEAGVLEKGGSMVGDTPLGMMKAVERAEPILQKAKQEVIETLEKEASQAVPSYDRISARLDTIAASKAGTFDQVATEKAVANVRANLKKAYDFQTIQEKNIPAHPGELKFNEYGHARWEGATEARVEPVQEVAGPSTWKRIIESRDQLEASLTKDTGIPMQVRREVLNAIDDEVKQAMLGAEELGSGLKGISDKYAAAKTELAIAKDMKENLGNKFGEQRASTQPKITAPEVGAAAAMTMMGHPAVAAGFAASKVLGRTVVPKVERWMAQRAYASMVGTEAAGATQAARVRIKDSVAKFFKKGPRTGSNAVYAGSKKREGYDRKAYQEAAARTEQLISDSHRQRVLDMAREVEAQGYADLAKAMLDVNHRATQYLMWNQVPTNGAANLRSLGPVPVSKTPTMKEYRFMRIDKALKNPFSLLEDLESGSLSRDAVNAVKYVYPEIHAEIVNNVAEQIYEMKAAGEHLPMDKIAMLGTVLDAPVDPKLRNEYIQEIQMSLQAPPPGTEPPQQAPSPQVFGFQDFATPLQMAQVG